MTRTICLVLVFASVICTTAFQQRQIDSKLPDLPLRILSTTRVEGIASPVLTFPIFCSSNGRIVIRLASTEGQQETVAISPDGSKVVRFGREKLIDIQNATVRGMFATDSDIYEMVIGYSDFRSGTQWIPKKDGSYDEQRVQLPRKRIFYLARFDLDGQYKGSIVLDTPFAPRQFGVFQNGDFLVAGRTEDPSPEPRVALFRSNGQFMRLLELEKDISSSSPQFKKDAPDPVMVGMNNLQLAIDWSSIVQDGNELLLVRKGQAAPIFAISAGGAVRRIKLEVPDNLSLYSLHPAGREWIGQFFSREEGIPGQRLTSYAIDRESGKPTANYNYALQLGMGLACIDGTEFTFIKKEFGSGELSSVRASPTRQSTLPRDSEILPRQK